MKEGFITFNALGIPVFVNQHFCEMTGYTQEEIIGRPASAFLDAENLRIFQSEFSRRSSGHLSPYEIVFKRKDGSPIDFLVSPRPLYDSTGRFAGSIGTCMDITERKKMEEALRQSEERYRTILGTIEDGYHEVDLAGRFTFFNESFQKIIGYDHDELLGMHYRHYADELADMAVKIENARNLCLKAAWLKDQGQPYGYASAMAKYYAAEIAMEVTTQAVQIHGGYGYVKEYHVERLMREAKLTQIYEGTSEIQQIIISREVLK
jgi:PAS domain S-box-containing protein